MFGGILLGVGDKEASANILYVEGSKFARNAVVVKGLFRKLNFREVRVVHFDLAGPEIGYIEEASPVDVTGRVALVNSFR